MLADLLAEALTCLPSNQTRGSVDLVGGHGVWDPGAPCCALCEGRSSLHSPPPSSSSAFSLWQQLSQALDLDWTPGQFRPCRPSSQMQMEDHQGCPRLG